MSWYIPKGMSEAQIHEVEEYLSTINASEFSHQLMVLSTATDQEVPKLLEKFATSLHQHFCRLCDSGKCDWKDFPDWDAKKGPATTIETSKVREAFYRQAQQLYFQLAQKHVSENRYQAVSIMGAIIFNLIPPTAENKKG